MFDSTKKIHHVKIKVHVTQRDIDDSDCRDARSCMIRNATERELRKLDTSVSHHHTRVDAGHIKANIFGYGSKADMPKKGKDMLVLFDSEQARRRMALKDGVKFESAVKPFTLTLDFERGAKVQKFSRARQEQVNAARRKRTAAGQPQKRYTLRQRIVGFA
jgi:hypothetical protein